MMQYIHPVVMTTEKRFIAYEFSEPTRTNVHCVSEAAPGQCRAVKFFFNVSSPDNHLKQGRILLDARKL